MKRIAGKVPLCGGGLLLATLVLAASGFAQSSDLGTQGNAQARASANMNEQEFAGSAESPPTLGLTKTPNPADTFSESRLDFSLLKNIVLDQKAIWTSPAHLRLEDANWLLPFAGIVAASLVSDTHVSTALTRSTTVVKRSNTFSNAGVAALGGLAGGVYLFGEISADDHKEESGILSGEAVLDALGTTTGMQYAFGRQQPSGTYTGGQFWNRGTSFPSDHAAMAWAAASVLAHEYPGPLTKLLLYGLASGVSFARVTGKDHFPSDVIAGSAIGWLIGQHVYRAHHDPDLGGGSWQTFAEARAEDGGRNFRNTGSPYVSLDSWIYPALDRLIALGYIHSSFQDVRPLTRLECASLVEEAGDSLASGAGGLAPGAGDSLYAALEKEFQSEFAILDGESGKGSGPEGPRSSGTRREQSIQLESVYSNMTEIAGRPLNDSDHFGETLIDNFGRPYEQGFNTYDGLSGYGTTGRYVVYVRGELQQAPSAPAYSLAAREAIATTDLTPLRSGAPVPATRQFRLLDTYVSANLAGWDVSIGKQSLWWGRGVGGALMFSDNAEPIYMLRLRLMEPIELPWILHWLGPMKGDFFLGKLSGNEYPARPLIHGLKLTAKPFRYFEGSLLATTEFGGVGRALTVDSLLNSFFSIHSSDSYLPSRSPGKRTIGSDFTVTFPHLHDRLQMYANGLLPEDNPTNFDMSRNPIYIWQRLAIRSGIYVPRLPIFSKLDFRVESAYTDPPTGRSRYGQYIYYNNFYRDLYTNKGNLIGDWVGRQGMGFQGWSTYWLTAKSSLQVAYRHAKVDSSFIPAGETINDGSVQANWQLRPDLRLSASVQVEKWFAPILASTAETDVTSSVSVQFTPQRWGL